MTNNIIAIDFNGVKVVLDSNTKLIHLIKPLVADTETLHNIADNSNYQVPTGKKATVIFSTKNFPNHDLIYADNLSGTTNEVSLLDNSGTAIDNTIIITVAVPADKFITIKAAEGINADEFTLIEETA